MRLGWIELRNFRSYESCYVEPDPGVNVLIGSNAAGKTNFLEAVAYFASLRSFRRVPDEVLIRVGGERGWLRARASTDTGHSTVEIELARGAKRRALVNGKAIRGVQQLLGQVRAVAFLPDDLDLVKRGPSLRRAFLDELAVQLWPASYAEQREYQRALRQRNALLRRAGRGVDEGSLEAWDVLLSQAGAKVFRRRRGAMGALGAWVSDVYRRLSGREGEVELRYGSTWGGTLQLEDDREAENGLRKALHAARPSDRERRVTTVGIHRDDPSFFLDGRDTRTYVSQGEQRTLALALRLAAHRSIAARLGDEPILLLDDVFSELDMDRANALAGVLPEAQTFITTTRPEEMPVAGRRWDVEEGKIR
jgi:DNA replication and repair protein RecF